MPLWLRLECPQAVPGSKELGLERGRRLLVDGGHSFGTQGLEGGKMSQCQALAQLLPGDVVLEGLSVQMLLLEMQRSLYLCMCHL